MAVYMGGFPQKQVTFDWFGEAFNEYKKYAVVWIGILLVAALPPLAIGMVQSFLTKGSAFGSPTFGPSATPLTPTYWISFIFVEIAAIVYGAWISAGMFKIAATQVRGEPIELGMLFNNTSRMWAMLGYSIVMGVVSYIGFILCIFPGLCLTAMFYPGMVLVADGVSFSEAMSRSINGMKANWAMGGLLVLCFFLLYIVSAIPCGLGLLVTAPMGILIAALAARDMCGLRGPASTDYSVGYNAPTPGVWPPPPSTSNIPQQQSPQTPGLWPPQDQSQPSVWPPQDQSAPGASPPPNAGEQGPGQPPPPEPPTPGKWPN